jgi:Tfp pilus assembly protein PilF
MTAALALALLAAAAAPKVLVLPPEPVGDMGAAAWIGEAVADVLPRDLERLGVPVVSRADRLAAHEALDIPAVTLTRASSIRFAEALGVARIVSGTFERRGSDITVSLRWLDVERGTLSAPFNSSASLDNVAVLVHGLAWDIALAGPWKPAGTRDSFLASARALSFPAFEAYGMGLAAAKAASRKEHLRRALERDPAFDEARLGLGREQIDARDYAAAHDTLSKVPATSPLVRPALFLQGVALLEMARYDEAGALFARLAETLPTAGVLSNHGLAVLRAKEKRRASDLLRQAVDKAPGITDVAFNLGWALLVEGDAEAAVFWLRGVVRQAPRDARARAVLSWALRTAGHASEAAEEWRGVALLGAPDGLAEAPDLTRRLGRVLLSEVPITIERSDVELAVAHVGRADALFKANDTDGALRELTRAAYLDPYSARAHELLARVHLHRGEKEKAVSELQMSLWCREDAAIRLHLARLLAELGRAAEARLEAERILRADPGNEAARTLLKSTGPDL